MTTQEPAEIDAPGTAVAVADGDDGALVAPGGGDLTIEHEHHQPSPRQYVLIGLVLVVITGVEIATSYIDTTHTNLVIVALFTMGFVKFFLVAAWYMHMKTDQPFFRRIFVVGVVGATIVYGIVMLMFSSTVLKS